MSEGMLEEKLNKKSNIFLFFEQVFWSVPESYSRSNVLINKYVRVTLHTSHEDING